MQFLEKGQKIFKKGKKRKNILEKRKKMKIFSKRAGYCMQLLHAINC